MQGVVIDQNWWLSGCGRIEMAIAAGDGTIAVVGSEVIEFFEAQRS